MNSYGLKPSAAGVRDYDFFAVCGSKEQELPPRFLLPIDEWAEVLDQLNTLSCVGHALAVAQACYHFKETGEQCAYSPGYIYGHPECRLDYNGGGMFAQQAMKGVCKCGFVERTLFDVLKEMPEMRTLVEARADLTDRGAKRKLKGFVNLMYSAKERTAEAIKKALVEYEVPIIISSYKYFGEAHCVALYGWDDAWGHKKAAKGTQVFAFRNSWGKKYEDGGNSTIPITYIDQAYLPIFEDTPMPFVDVKERDWFYNDVKATTFSGLFTGTSKTTFEPNVNAIRGDFALSICRAMDKAEMLVNTFIKTLNQKGKKATAISWRKPTTNAVPFADVKKTDYFYDAVYALRNCGMMEGVGDKFEPLRNITRAEVAAVLVRCHDYLVKLLEAAIEGADVDTASNVVRRYKDVAVGQWFYSHVQRISGLGVMQGDEDGNFRPDGNIIRAEMAAVLNRFFRLLDKTLEKVG